jgi:UDP-N-acetylglucosamine:LPS N-acetylglucosamine transferase
MRDKSIIFVYGEGGHKAQMNKLLHLMKQEKKKNIRYIGICENNYTLDILDENYSFLPLRDKHSNLRTLSNAPTAFFNYLKVLFILYKKYDVKAVVSTGPGIAIIVSLFFKILNKKIVFIETWSRFEGKSMTGKIMYKIADKFYIQNKSLQKHYPKAIYGGLL